LGKFELKLKMRTSHGFRSGGDNFDWVREIRKDVLIGDSIVEISPPTSIGLERSREHEEEEREVQMGEDVYADKN